MRAYKLFRKRRDNTLGPLFINRKLRVKLGTWYDAEDHPTKGYAHRPGWHAGLLPKAPHLTVTGRVWCEVELEDVAPLPRPESQGGLWLLARRMKVVREMDIDEVWHILLEEIENDRNQSDEHIAPDTTVENRDDRGPAEGVSGVQHLRLRSGCNV